MMLGEVPELPWWGLWLDRMMVLYVLQGFLVSEGRTWGVNQAAWIGAIVMLGSAYIASQLGQNGAISAAIGMILGNVIEVSYLFYNWRSKTKTEKIG